VCCNSACGGECEACNVTGSVGTCTAKPAGTACGLAGCVGGYTVAASTCDGTSNACPLGAISPCPNGLKCLDKISCKSGCASDADCLVGTCDTTTGKCASTWDGGGIDTGGPDTEMPDTFVADTFVPDTSMPDTAMPDTTVVDTAMPDTSAPDTFVADTATAADTLVIAEVGSPPFKDQTKVVGEFTRCSKDSECTTGHCVEGVCCDTACKDRCHSCALLTSPGKCTLEPIGVDLKSECGPALACLGTCGAAGECIGSGSGTMCARNRCTTASTGVGPAYCSAPGAACNEDEAVPFDCGSYICEPAFGACRTTCASSTDCAQGFICDVPSKTCVAAPAPVTTDDGGGGCAVSSTAVSRSTSGLVFLGIAIAALRRRRR
jgi:MYXO-CTERM domain-containing protein